MNIYVQLEKNANKHSFFLYILLIPATRGEEPAPSLLQLESGRSQEAKSLDAPGHSSRPRTSTKIWSYKKQAQGLGVAWKMGSQQTASQSGPRCCLCQFQPILWRLTFQMLVSVATWLPACRARLRGSHILQAAPSHEQV